MSIPRAAELKEVKTDIKRMRVVSDGTVNGTKIFDSNGHKFDAHVEKITIEIDALGGVTKMTMVILNVELDMQMDAEIEHKDLER